VEDLRGAIDTSLAILRCGPLALTIPLLGAVYLAPVSFIVDPDVTLFLQGITGSLKSTLSALALRHYGSFHRKALPAHWTSTDNSLEYRLAILKDVLCAIDDYSPQPSARAQRELEARAERVLRSVGNRACRGRMRADLSQRPDRPPRGLLMSSGEDLPVGASLQARLFVVEIDRERLDLDLIGSIERDGERLGHALRGYLEWLAPQMSTLHTVLPQAQGSFRERFRGIGNHLRQPEALSLFFLGFDLLLQFATEAGALADSAADEWRQKAYAALAESANAQGETLHESDAAEMFIEALRAQIQQGTAQIVAADGVGRLDRGPMIGKVDGDNVFLLPRAAKQIAHRFLTTGDANNRSPSHQISFPPEALPPVPPVPHGEKSINGWAGER
jgi:hypothetical protein